MAPGNGIFVVRGELSTLMTAMRRGARWNSNSYQDEGQSGLLRPLSDLKVRLNQTEDLRHIDPNEFLTPFLDVVKSEETTGQATSLALSAVNKFLSYGLIDPTHGNITQTMQNIAYAVTHARFVGTDQASDAVVLMKIVQVLSTIMLSPEGSSLTNEMLCEVMLSCFRICFEPRLNEILRRSAEQALRDMVLLLFMRLPQFVEDLQPMDLVKKLKMVANDPGTQKRRKSRTKVATLPDEPLASVAFPGDDFAGSEAEPTSPNMQLGVPHVDALRAPALSTTPMTPAGNIVDMRGKFIETPSSTKVAGDVDQLGFSPVTTAGEFGGDGDNEADVEDEGTEPSPRKGAEEENEIEGQEEENKSLISPTERPKEEYVNSVGVRFTQQASRTAAATNGELIPYALPCIRELLRFLVTLCNPLDKQNTDVMIHMGLSLLTVALEVGADSIGKYETLRAIVRDDMCRNLFFLLSSERLSIFAADLQLCFLLFESLRGHLKFQLEAYLTKLSEIIASESPKVTYETRELALENVLQLLRIPGFATELYINYDCNLYCSNVFEELTKLLSKIALAATQSILPTHLLAVDALVTIVELVEKNCGAAQKGATASIGSRHSRNNSTVDKIVLDIETAGSGNESSTTVENIHSFIGPARRGSVKAALSVEGVLTPDQIAVLKEKKRVLSQGTELFNNRAEKGIQYLQENGVLNPVLDPREIAHFLRENSYLDKKQIGEYVSKKKNVESKILEHFVKSFDFANMRIDMALRIYLETFRLPGEAPLISLVMEHFSDHWHILNGEPFAHVDAAFGLAYAVIMLNMDQHNHNVKKMNIPMNVDEFVKNLRGMNGKADFDQKMLVDIYNAIKTEEIVMPAEQTGLIRESYLWKVLLRRGATADGQFHHVSGTVYDKEIFRVVWGSTLAALSFIFDKSPDQAIGQKAINGFTRSASIAANYHLTADFDALVLTLCKFTSILNPSKEMTDIQLSVALGLNQKAQAAARTVFGLVQRYGDCMREGWKNIFEVLGQLFKLKLLPRALVEIEDFCKPNGKYVLLPERIPVQRSEAAGLFSSLYSYLSSDNQRQPSYEEQEIIKVAKKCIKECRIEQIIQESKFLHVDSLQELLRALEGFLKPPTAHKSVGGTRYEEDLVLFMLEVYVKILIQNRDRLLPIWERSKEPLYRLLFNDGKSYGYDQLLVRVTVEVFKLSAFLMRNEELCPVVLQSLKTFLRFKPTTVLKLAKAISIGMYELLKTSAQNIHTEADWAIVFTVLECVGAGAINKEVEQQLADQEPAHGTAAAKSDGALSSEEDSGVVDRGYTSDSELIRQSTAASPSPTENWIMVTADADVQNSPVRQPQANSLAYPCKLMEHSPFALVKCWDSLAFIVRNVAHITPYNFEGCVRCIRTFVEASLSGPRLLKPGPGGPQRGKQEKRNERRAGSGAGEEGSSDGESDTEELSDRYPTIAIQFLDIMHTLHTRTAQIFRWWAEEGGAVPQCSTLWAQGWCPLLQGMARLATDQRRNVRTGAITCLQRALLVHDLQTLSGPEWEGCFRQVLFPLLSTLLLEQTASDPSLLEESRMRTATIMSKVFLHHLTPLLSLAEFAHLWLEILEYLERFMKIGSDMLYEAMLEGLKNMLLVMHSVRVFHTADGQRHSPLWDVTWQKIGQFLPNLKEDLFKEAEDRKRIDVPVMSVGEVESQQMPPVVAFYPPQHVHANEGGEQNEIIVSELNSGVTADAPADQGQVEIISYAGESQVVSAIVPESNAGVGYPVEGPGSESPQRQLHYQNLVSLQMGGDEEAVIPDQAASQRLQHQLLMDQYHQQQQAYQQMMINQTTFTGSAQSSPTHHLMNYNNIKDSAGILDQQKQPGTPQHAAAVAPPIPGSQYPTFSGMPPTNIVQSFAPMFVQPTAVQNGGEIYSDYVRDPYNLTLPSQLGASAENTGSNSNAATEQPVMMAHAPPSTGSSVFQSSNYFGSDTGIIPPGSEVLFGGGRA